MITPRLFRLFVSFRIHRNFTFCLRTWRRVLIKVAAGPPDIHLFSEAHSVLHFDPGPRESVWSLAQPKRFLSQKYTLYRWPASRIGLPISNFRWRAAVREVCMRRAPRLLLFKALNLFLCACVCCRKLPSFCSAFQFAVPTVTTVAWSLRI